MTETSLPDEFEARGWDVPSMSEVVFAPKKHRYVIVIPVINEGKRIQQQLQEMAASNVADIADIVIVDGGSTDGSLEPDFLTGVHVSALLTKLGPGKLSAQLRCAYAWALVQGYEGIITIDGNGKDGVETIPDFVKGLDEGYGYLQASRFKKGGHHENTPLARWLAIRLIHAPIQSLSAGVWLTDTTQGYRSYSSDYLLHPGVQPFRSIFSKYELLVYLTVRASQLGFKVKEIATRRIYPANEPTPTKISGLSSLVDLVMVVLSGLFRVYHPKRDDGH